MNHHHCFAKVLLPLVLLGSLGAADAQARDHDRGGYVRGRMVYDTRYHHNHYYPAPGFVAPLLPSAALSISFGADSYWYGGGVWYRPYAGRYRVVLPPLGVVVPALPGDYVTLTIGGSPYFYANGVYYSPYRGGPGYVVVAPPAEAARAEPAPALAKPDPVIYPRNNQSPEQTETDHRECNRWATTQPSAQADAQVFSRAVAACLDGRGYSVR